MSQPRERVRLAVIDPGLLESAGHHAGFASVLSSSYSRYRSEFEVIVLAHKKVEPQIVEQLRSSGVDIEPFFEVAFYRYFERAGNVARRHQYISELSKAYLQAFSRLRMHWGENVDVVLLYHTLSWEHASALSLAIRYFGKRGASFQHEVFLMFSPGIDEYGEIYDRHRALNYRSAFSGLVEQSNVTLSASCTEYANAYALLLERDTPLSIHPCFLADWPALQRSKSRDQAIDGVDLNKAKVLLYLGDAKAEKGFLQMPELVREWQALLGDEAEMLIHFTHRWSNDAIDRVVVILAAMAEKDKRIRLATKFMDDDDLHALIRGCDIAVVSYNEQVYQNKTSGIMWLLAYYNIVIVLYSSGWLLREGRRLSSRLILSSNLKALTGGDVDKRILSFSVRPTTIGGDELYAKQLYCPFWDAFSQLSS